MGKFVLAFPENMKIWHHRAYIPTYHHGLGQARYSSPKVYVYSLALPSVSVNIGAVTSTLRICSI